MFSCGLVSVSFRSLDVREILSLCKRAGLSLVEWGSDIHAPCKDMERLEFISRLQRQMGVSCSSYGTYFRLGIHPVEELEDYIRAAKVLGTHILRIWCGDRNYGDLNEEERKALIEQGKRAAAMAEREGVILCAECHPNTFTVCLEGALALIEGVNSPAMRMYWQPNQYVSFEENCEYAKNIAPYVYNLHVFHWEGKNKYPLADGVHRWTAYLSYFQPDCTLLLEFMPDGLPQTLPREAETLRRLTGEIDSTGKRGPVAGVCIDPLLEQIRACVKRHRL